MQDIVRANRLLPIALCALYALLAGCVSTPVAPPAETAVRGERQHVVEIAERMLGTPYRPGGASPRGFDCSGLVSYTFQRAGIDVPRTAAEQFLQAHRVNGRALLPGDLLFFKTTGRRVSHVGIYVGERRFVHAPSGGKQVTLESLDNPYWRQRMVAAGDYFFD